MTYEVFMRRPVITRHR